MARAVELMWILDHREDVESDFRVFHPYLYHEDPSNTAESLLDGPLFFTLAERLPNYRGVLRDFATVEAAEKEEATKRPSVTPASPQHRQTPVTGRQAATSPQGANGKKNVHATRGVVENSPLAGLIDWE